MQIIQDEEYLDDVDLDEIKILKKIGEFDSDVDIPKNHQHWMVKPVQPPYKRRVKNQRPEQQLDLPESGGVHILRNPQHLLEKLSQPSYKRRTRKKRHKLDASKSEEIENFHVPNNPPHFFKKQVQGSYKRRVNQRHKRQFPDSDSDDFDDLFDEDRINFDFEDSYFSDFSEDEFETGVQATAVLGAGMFGMTITMPALSFQTVGSGVGGLPAGTLGGGGLPTIPSPTLSLSLALVPPGLLAVAVFPPFVR